MTICHVMLDTETLGTRPGAIILSAAFVRFEDEAHCSLNMDQASQTMAGCHFDQLTLDWWGQQDPAAWRLATENAVDARAALQYFGQWFDWAAGGREVFLWCHGATFDAPILGELYRLFGLPTPWKWWNVRDTRTLYDLAGVDVKAFAVPPPHVALNGAIGQTRAAVEAMRRIAAVRANVT